MSGKRRTDMDMLLLKEYAGSSKRKKDYVFSCLSQRRLCSFFKKHMLFGRKNLLSIQGRCILPWTDISFQRRQTCLSKKSHSCSSKDTRTALPSTLPSTLPWRHEAHQNASIDLGHHLKGWDAVETGIGLLRFGALYLYTHCVNVSGQELHSRCLWSSSSRFLSLRSS